MHDTNPTIHMPFLVYWNVKSTIRPGPASVLVPCSCAHHKACYAARIRQLYLLLRSRGTGVRYRARDGAARPSRPVPDYSARRLPIRLTGSRIAPLSRCSSIIIRACRARDDCAVSSTQYVSLSPRPRDRSDGLRRVFPATHVQG